MFVFVSCERYRFFCTACVNEVRDQLTARSWPIHRSPTTQSRTLLRLILLFSKLSYTIRLGWQAIAFLASTASLTACLRAMYYASANSADNTSSSCKPFKRAHKRKLRLITDNVTPWHHSYLASTQQNVPNTKLIFCPSVTRWYRGRRIIHRRETVHRSLYVRWQNATVYIE